jgi:hypothetical protein
MGSNGYGFITLTAIPFGMIVNRGVFLSDVSSILRMTGNAIDLV